jgi:hypothetical protein
VREQNVTIKVLDNSRPDALIVTRGTDRIFTQILSGQNIVGKCVEQTSYKK